MFFSKTKKSSIVFLQKLLQKHCTIFSKTPGTKFSNMSIFAQRLNPLTGKCEWEQEPENYDYHQEVARSAFADMLHDTERNQKYELALKRAIDKMHSSGKKANVLDIGTGTGLLSMMAVRCGADSVTACESFKPMANCAANIIKNNGFSQNIKIIPKRSTEIIVGDSYDMKQRANILVTEVFDTELIGEGAIGTFIHAHKYLLEKDSIVIPCSGTIYAQVVQCPVAHSWHKLKDLADADGEIIIRTPHNVQNCAGSAAVHDIQLSQIPFSQVTLLSDPVPVVTFDWSGKTELKMNNSLAIKTQSKANGIAQLVFMWWTLSMDEGKEILLSCAPFWAHPDVKNGKYPQETIPWRDHWMQALYYIPNEVALNNNEYFNLLFSHDEYSMWFNVLPLSKPLTSLDFKAPICECMMHCAYSRTRIGQINDGRRNKLYSKVLREHVNQDTVCLVLSDGSLLGLGAAKMGAKHVYVLESNYLSSKAIQNYISHNEFNNVTILDHADKIQNCIHNINLIFAEPHFISSLLPWDNAYFAYIKENIKSENIRVIPEKGVVWMVPVEFRDLHKIRAPLFKCEGFDMEPFDKLIESSSNLTDCIVEPQPLWEYPSKCLGKPEKILELCLTEKEIKALCYNGKKNFGINGVCNGIALWVDWHLDGTTKNIWSTGPQNAIEVGDRIKWDMFTRQGVHLIPSPKQVHQCDFLQYSVSCNIKKGELHFGFDVIS